MIEILLERHTMLGTQPTASLVIMTLTEVCVSTGGKSLSIYLEAFDMRSESCSYNRL